MSTKFLSPGWRMPRNANQSKSANYSLDLSGAKFIDCGTSVYDKIRTSSGNSVAGWFKIDNLASGDILLFNFRLPFSGSAIQRDYAFYWSTNATSNIKIYVDNSAKITYSNFSPVAGVWYHACVSVEYGTDTTKQILYINGQNVATASSAITSLPNQISNLYINQWYSSTWSAIQGSFSDISIFDYALSASQVTTLWGGGTSVSNPMALPRTPIAYYPLGTSAWNGEYLAENNAIGDYVFYFNGASYIDLGNSSLGLTANTISIWFKTTSTTSGQQLLSKMGSTYQFQFRLETNGTISLYSFQDQSTFATLQSSSGYNDGNWHNVISTFNTTDGHKMYVDGNTTPVDTDTVNKSALQSSSERMLIGVRDSSTGVIDTARYFNGDISNTQIFNTALTGPEVETLYNYGSPIQTLANIPQNSNLKAWYKLDASEIYNSSTTEWSIDNNQNPSAYPSSLDFDGTNDYIGIPNSTDFNLGTSFTISGWFNVTSYVSNMGYISFDSSTRGWFLFHQSTNLALYDGAAVRTLNSNLQPTNEWNSYIITYDGTDLIFYLNGQQNSTQSVSINLQTNGNDGQIGNQQFAAGRFYNGYVSNVAIYNTALSASNVVTLYNNGTPQATIYGSPVAHWKLDNTTTGIQDSAGSNDGTNNGASDYAGFVNVLAGDSTGMSQSNLVQSDLQTVAPYSKYALDFDGVNDYIRIRPIIDTTNVAGGIVLANNFTVSYWIKLTSSANNKGAINGQVNSDGIFSFFRFALIRNGQQNLRINSTYVPVTPVIDNGDWYNIIYCNSYDNTELKVYTNNSLTYENTTHNFGRGNNIGNIARSEISSITIPMQMSNLSVWNKQLSSSEVSEIYNEGVPSNLNNHSAYSNLVSWWQLGSNTSWVDPNWTVLDEKGSNNGVSSNMGEIALTNGVGTTANGVSSGMSEGSLVGDAPYSTANAISSGMSIVSRVSGVSDATITTGGTGYSTGTNIAITGGSGTNCTINITTVSGGAITAITINSGGNNYLIGDVLTVSGGNGNATITVSGLNTP